MQSGDKLSPEQATSALDASLWVQWLSSLLNILALSHTSICDFATYKIWTISYT